MKVDVELSTEGKSKIALKADSIFQVMEDKSPAQIKSWIDANINSIADVRKILTLLILGMKSRGG